MHHFSISDNDFTLDGHPIQIVSGAMHYFRIVPEYWRDRLLKLKACGLNAVETYVPWNLHEPQPGHFGFAGMLDIVRYIELAAELDLLVIVRPGPYICSEWDFGGLPAWLLADPGMRLRCYSQPYLAAVDRFFDALMPQLAPLQITQGGPIIAMQVENEYGSYGNDKRYLRHLADGMRARGIDILLFTSDGPTDWMLQGGTLPDIFKVANFGSRPAESFSKLRKYQSDGPLMCGEYWNGWFDDWGGAHHYRDPQEAADVLDEMLAMGASVNFYMFHGGTSFGFMSGANQYEKYTPDVSSYDYGAPLDEAGDPSPKFHACREVIGKYLSLPDMPIPQPSPKAAYGKVTLSERVSLFDALETLSRGVERPTPEPMEYLGQNYGFILYRTVINGPREACKLELQQVHDRAQVFVDGEYQGVIYRNDAESQIILEFGPGEHRLDLLVENMGRVNYGPQLHDRKGITEGVRLASQFLFGWTIYSLPLDDLSALTFATGAPIAGPAFYRGSFNIETPMDTFLALPGWTKGVCFINGFNLGRYWEIGPQRTLYVPAPLLRAGRNEITVFELHGVGEPVVEFRDHPELG